VLRLRFIQGDLAGRTIDVAGRRFAIGRGDDNDLRIPASDKRTSRNHAELIRDSGGWVVRDPGSATGVWLDARRIAGPARLKDGQTLTIGAQVARVTLDGVASPGRDDTFEVKLRGPASRSPGPASGSPQRSRTVILANDDNKRIRVLTFMTAGAIVLALAIGAIVLFRPTGTPAGASRGLDAAALVKAAKPSTVLVDMRIDPSLGGAAGLDNNRISSGSGWVLDATKGEIVTNAHVAVGGQTVKVATPGGQARDARVLAIDVCDDVALLKTSDTSGLRTLPRVSQSELSEGDPVVALGFPGSLGIGDNLTTTTGVISVVKTSARINGYPNVVQTDAAINHGNSGGPLLDARGRLVGMNTLADLQTSENQAFAIATDHITSLLPELRDRRSTAWLGYALEFPTDNAPTVTGSDGTTFFGPTIIGRAESAPENKDLAGLAGDKTQLIYAIDGKSFGPGAGELPLAAGDASVCAVAANKHTGDTSVLSIIEAVPGGQYRTYEVTVKYA
jgi:S1-C subfamily serine protease/pSer/pThr/pTyr-binding forkhead associated (FHA) protein